MNELHYFESQLRQSEVRVECKPIVYATKVLKNESIVFGKIWLLQIFKEITEKWVCYDRRPFVKGDNWQILRNNWKTLWDMI